MKSILQKQLIDKNLVLVTAESCTGGGIARAITDLPGASALYWGGWVVYQNEAKKHFLGVKQETLERCGAVSVEVLKEMLSGALSASPADIALAVSGIAGPGGGSPEKPVGTVWIGLAFRSGKTVVRKEIFQGDRSGIREQTVQAIFALLEKEFVGSSLDSSRGRT